MGETNKFGFEILDVFVEKLVEEKGLDYLDKDVLEQIKSDIRSRLEDFINLAILENLPPEKLADFENLLNKNASDEEVQIFCKENIPDIEEILAKTLLDFRQTYLGLG